MSRAIDEKGNVQPRRDAWLEGKAVNTFYHYNAIQSWAISSGGEISNVYL